VELRGVAVEVQEPRRTAAEGGSSLSPASSRRRPSPTLTLAPSSSSKSPPPSDANFKWARDSYSGAERTLDVWSFVLTLRARLYLLDAKFTYLGGFSEEKQKQRRRRWRPGCGSLFCSWAPRSSSSGSSAPRAPEPAAHRVRGELSKLQDKVPASRPRRPFAAGGEGPGAAHRGPLP